MDTDIRPASLHEMLIAIRKLRDEVPQFNPVTLTTSSVIQISGSYISV